MRSLFPRKQSWDAVGPAPADDIAKVTADLVDHLDKVGRYTNSPEFRRRVGKLRKRAIAGQSMTKEEIVAFLGLPAWLAKDLP
jgi:hypothetical protein